MTTSQQSRQTPVGDLRLTPSQRKVLEILEGIGHDDGMRRWISPRNVAKALWPDSPAWGKRTRRYGRNANGAVGGTMPMNAAKILNRLEALGVVEEIGYLMEGQPSAWVLTPRGEQWLEAHR